MGGFILLEEDALSQISSKNDNDSIFLESSFRNLEEFPQPAGWSIHKLTEMSKKN